MTEDAGIVAFIEARITEDEATAKAWELPPRGEDATRWKPVGRREPRYDNGRSETFSVIDVSGRDLNWSEAIQVRWDSNGERVGHIARHDPARALREVEADRKLLNLYERARNYRDRVFAQPEPRSVSDEMRAVTQMLALEQVIRLRAAVHSDHPGYLAEWASTEGAANVH